LYTLTLFAMIAPLAMAQHSALPPVTLGANSQAVSTQPGAEPMSGKSSYYPPFCPPKTCLYYAGDFDSNDSNANALYNADDESADLLGQVWVGVRPAHDAIVTGVTFNQILYGEGVGTNPTPFAIQVGIRPGQAGKTICSTSGNATASIYQYSETGSTWSYTIKKLSKPCKLKKGTVYYVNMLPTYGNGYYGYVVDVEDPKPANHRGWKNILDDSYFNSAAFGATYQPTWGPGGACHQTGCDAFSIALTGTETE
jgi:hypothetical protein